MEAERRHVTVLFADMYGVHTFFRAVGRGSRLFVDAKPIDSDLGISRSPREVEP